MKITKTKLAGVVLLELKAHQDSRGVFTELFVAPRYTQAGITQPFVQDNWSHSKRGVLRGLHFQKNQPQGKLVSVCHGHIWDVVLDINPASPTFGQYVAFDLYGYGEYLGEQDRPMQQLWVPPGYAHGFCVLSEQASVLYKCTEIYCPHDQAGIVWSDSQLGIQWPVADPLVSQRDQQLPNLQQYTEQNEGALSKLL